MLNWPGNYSWTCWMLIKSFQNRRSIYYSLLRAQAGFNGFFELIDEKKRPPILNKGQLANFLQNQYASLFCGRAELGELIERFPVELAYAIALITTDDPESLPPGLDIAPLPCRDAGDQSAAH
jgi:ATP-dependent DNA helicase RecQ